MYPQTQSFRLQATLSSGGLVRWRTRIASEQGFSSCQSAKMNGVWIHMVATMQIWRLAQVTQLLISLFFLHLRTTSFPGPDSITRSEQAQQRRLERKAAKHERRQSRRTTHPASSLLMCLRRRWRKTQRVQTPCRDSSLWCTPLLGLTHLFHTGSMEQVRAKLHNKIT